MIEIQIADEAKKKSADPAISFRPSKKLAKAAKRGGLKLTQVSGP